MQNFPEHISRSNCAPKCMIFFTKHAGHQHLCPPASIAGHLAHYIGTGKLAITDFIDDEKIGRIAAALAETGAEELGPAKRLLGDYCSSGELTMVRAHLAREP